MKTHADLGFKSPCPVCLTLPFEGCKDESGRPQAVWMHMSRVEMHEFVEVPQQNTCGDCGHFEDQGMHIQTRTQGKLL